MKKIDKIDMFLFVCIVLGCVFGLVTMISGWILGEQILWLKAITGLLFFFPTCTLLGAFASKVLVQIINNNKEKKKNKESENEKN